MNRKKLHTLLWVVAIIIVIAVSGVSILYSGRRTPSKTVADYASFIDALQASGVSVKSAGELPKSFFSVNGQAILINNQLVVVYEYPNASFAEAEARLVSPDGQSIGTSKQSWSLPAHFYKSGRLIALYVGLDQNVTKILESILGPQFAGG